jgi:glutathione S-transferase
MKLYYAPAACSLAPHIALAEAGLAVELVRVDLRTHTLPDGTDYYKVNAKGYVPLLELDDGTRITEVAVILQYIADRAPGTLAPAFGSLERYRLMEWLNFIATEVHKGFGPLWKPDTPAGYKTVVLDALAKRFDYLAPVLAAQPWLTGERFTVADAYLFTILNWSKILKVDLARWPALGQFQERVAARPRVQDALREEHLLKAAA